ncbi:MAG TPA: SprT family zinc-dependent metalloprotease [Opitutaceae bacterium]
MTDERQDDWFGKFAPSPGVHRAPPPTGDGPRDAVVFRRSATARNYRLSIGRDGVAVATIPVRGTQGEAERFVELNRAWLDRARERQRHRPRAADVWAVGTRVLWRGALEEIRVAAEGERPTVCLGADVFRVPGLDGDLRPALHSRFLRLAKVELPARAWELAAHTRMNVTRVSVRDQRSRWGSCTAAGVISLNWRLILTPESVRDYIILHELMHLREMNHSDRFWACVEEVFPGWREAEAWIKRNGGHAGL